VVRKLLFSVSIKDCKVETFRAGGKGGQKQNKTNSGVRVKHLPSGAVAESRTYRTQPENKKSAFLKMIKTKEFELWRMKEAARISGQDEMIEYEVNKAMQPKNLLVERKDPDGLWIEWTS
jgi:protein subunit release factor A